MQNALKFNENQYIWFAKLQKNMIICKMVMSLSGFYKPSKIRQKTKMSRCSDLFAIENHHDPHGTKYEPKRTNIFIGRSVRRLKYLPLQITMGIADPGTLTRGERPYCLPPVPSGVFGLVIAAYW